MYRINGIDLITSQLTTVDTKIDTIDTNVDTVNTKVDTIDTNVDTVNTKIGTNTDTALGTLFGAVHITEDHAHSAPFVYPTDAADITLTAGNPAWVAGAITEIIPASTITGTFDLHWVNVSNLSTNGIYEIKFYYGAGDTYCGSMRITRIDNFTKTDNLHFQTPLIPANSRIRAILSCSAGTATLNLSLAGHTY